MLKVMCKGILGVLASLAVLSGCTHSHPRGTVVFRDSPKSAHVCIGHDEVNPGDVVSIYRSVCRTTESTPGRRGPIARTSCEKQLVGEGKIVELSDQHFARMEVLGDLNLEQGLIIEKKVN